MVRSRVLFWSARPRSIPLEVLDQRRCIVPQITKVDGFASFLQQQDAIEGLKEFCRRLVNGAKDGLSDFGEAAQERYDGPSALRVQASGRLVQEQ